MRRAVVNGFGSAGLGVVFGLVAGLLLATAPLPSHANIDELETTEIPVSTDKQSRTIKLISYLIDKSHYHKKPLNDELSSEVFETYLDRLDPGKSIFMQSDIDQFQKLRHRFDDFIRNGAVQPVFVMFSLFRTRVEERVEFALARLDKPFDFDRDEEYQFDRENAEWASDMTELDDLWRKRIKNDILNLRLTGKDEKEITKTLTRRYTHLARRTRQLKSEDVFQIFVNSYAGNIDPHTSYFPPRASENFNIQMRLSLEGIGAVLQTDNEYTKVRRIIPGGPADLGQKLKAEDRIVGVAQDEEGMVDVIGWRLDDVVELIRGPKESVVRLEVLPPDTDANPHTKIISIQRNKINLEEQAAKKRVLEIETAKGESTIGVIDLPSFYSDFGSMRKKEKDYRSTTRDVRKLLKELLAEGIDGLVIDLRGNGGGALTEAVSLTGLFIKKGPVVQTRNSAGQIQVNRDSDPEVLYDGPLAVLVDRYSASASEIFTAAIQDYERGLVIGEPTFGKGTVQHLVDLNRFAKDDGKVGRLKVTIAQFFRINGDSTQHRGIIPDITWPSLTRDDEFGERAYENAIPWRRIDSTVFQSFNKAPSTEIVNRIQRLHQDRIHEDAEFQYFKAIDQLNAENRDKEFISLHETTRTQERKKHDRRWLKLENEMREATGKKTFDSIKALNEDSEEKSKAAENNRLQEPDAFLRESGSILGDYRYLLETAGISNPGKSKTATLVGN